MVVLVMVDVCNNNNYYRWRLLFENTYNGRKYQLYKAFVRFKRHHNLSFCDSRVYQVRLLSIITLNISLPGPKEFLLHLLRYTRQYFSVLSFLYCYFLFINLLVLNVAMIALSSGLATIKLGFSWLSPGCR